MIHTNQYAIDQYRRQDQMRQAQKWAQAQLVQKNEQHIATPKLKNERPQTQTGLYPAVQL